MNKNQLMLLAAAIGITVLMLLYPPYMMSLTGSDMGYHFAFRLPQVVSALGVMDTGRLVLQLAILWGIAAVAFFGLRKTS